MAGTESKVTAKEFAQYWKNKGYEKGESQSFWISLLGDVLGVECPTQFIRFEDKVVLDHTSFIDGIIPETHILIEQKARTKICVRQSNSLTALCSHPFSRQKDIRRNCRIPIVRVG